MLPPESEPDRRWARKLNVPRLEACRTHILLLLCMCLSREPPLFISPLSAVDSTASSVCFSRSVFNALPQAMTWSSMALTDFSCWGAGLKMLKFSKSGERLGVAPLLLTFTGTRQVEALTIDNHVLKPGTAR